uniref:SIS domain-containing protein n=1 Tax=Fervidicoccus fontis TaxID=683846 RepID=A0A7J3ZLH4_9CREN
MQDNMLKAYLKWKELSEMGVELANQTDFGRIANVLEGFRRVYVVGVGGSGIVGMFLSGLSSVGAVKVPIVSHQGFELPGPLDSSTLVIAISYSGNTIETLYAIRKALEKRTPIVGITSGGKLGSVLDSSPYSVVIKLPTGLLPRVSFPLMLFSALQAIKRLDLLERELDLESACKVFENVNDALSSSQGLCKVLSEGDRIPVFVTCTPYYSVALRFHDELAENTKLLSFIEILPNSGHNSVVAWRRLKGGLEKVFTLVTLQGSVKYCKHAIDAFYRALGSDAGYTIVLKGGNFLEEVLWGAWIAGVSSVKLAQMFGVKAEDTPEITSYRKALVETLSEGF